jgi:flagellar biosynthesis anti-sigma factor FlgM
MKAVSSSTGGGEVLQMTAFARKPAGSPDSSGPSPSGANPLARETPAVRLSTASRLAQVARSAVLSAPEIRVEAVEPLRNALNAGRYDFSPQRVAEKMVAGYG